MVRPDALIITALKEELDAVLSLGDGGRSGWQDLRDRSGFPFHVRTIPNERGEPLLLAAAWSGEMGRTAAAERARGLVDELSPGCLAMCGICAGRRGKVFLGDVIVADRVFRYDHGALLAPSGAPPEFFHDIETVNLEKAWRVDASYFRSELGWSKELLQSRPPSHDAQSRWILHTLYAHEAGIGPSPAEHPDCDTRCPSWTGRLVALRSAGLVELARGKLRLTEAGREEVENERVLHRNRMPADPEFRVHVGPIATGESVQKDPEIFARLDRIGRKTLGIEMEASAIAYVAEKLGRRSIIAKAVSDYGDLEKDDSFREFACRASATFLLAFFARHLEPRAGARSTPRADELAHDFGDRRLDPLDRPETELVGQVERICLLREGDGATVARRRAPPPLAGLLEVDVPKGRSVWRLPIGVVERSLDAQAIEAFAALVDATYRPENPYVPARILYAGPPPSASLEAQARARGIELLGFAEYQGILDLSRYARWQADRVEADGRYPSSLYVEQRGRFRIGRNPWQSTSDVIAEIQNALDSPHGRFLVVLGDFGTGKTFLMRELSRRLSQEGKRIPVLVEMRSLEKKRRLNELLAQHFAAADMGKIDLEGFRYMLAEGQVVLLFDGFDELAFRVSYDRVLEHFDTVLQAASHRAKVVVTSRTGHFLTDQEVNRELANRAEQIGHARMFKIDPFGEEQIRMFLGKLLQDEQAAEARFELLREVKDLLGLSHNPRMLGFIAQIDEHELRDAKARTGEISSATLYQILLRRWLDHEITIARETGADPDLGAPELWRAATDVALMLWPSGKQGLAIDEIPRELITAAQATGGDRKVEEGAARHQIGSRSLLVRDDEGRFSFLHSSVMEWLVANAAAEQVKSKGDATVLGQREMTDLMADFFAALSSPEIAARWAKKKLSIAGEDIAVRNALRVSRRLGQLAEGGAEDREAGPDFSNQDLSGQDLSGQDFRRANLEGADLSGSTLARTDLRGARLARARLARADLSEARLEGADLTEADLSWARLLGADLTGATLRRTRLRAARLVGARLPVLEECDDLGASPATTDGLEPMWSATSSVFALAFSPLGDLLVSGHSDGGVRLWDAMTGVTLRVLRGHDAVVNDVAVSRDGSLVASCSDDGTVRLWGLRAKLLATLTGHRGRVQSVAFAPDGRMLATGGDDGTVRIWDAREHRQIAVMGHDNRVRGVVFSPDGRLLASGSDDGTARLWAIPEFRMLRVAERRSGGVVAVAFCDEGRTLVTGSVDRGIRLWNCADGDLLAILEGHRGGIASLSVSPDNRILASCSGDMSVRLWALPEGKPIATLSGHTQRCTRVAFDPTGRKLASASADRTVRLWEVPEGKPIGVLDSLMREALSVVFGEAGGPLITGSSYGIRLWDRPTLAPRATLSGHTMGVLSVAASKDGHCLASGSTDGTVRLWEMPSGAPRAVLNGHAAAVNAVAFANRGELVASGSLDTKVLLWRTSSGELVRELAGPISEVWSVAASDETQMLASGSSDATVRLWRLPDGEPCGILEGHTDWVLGVAFRSDGRLLASASRDRTVRLWSIPDGECVSVLRDHGGWVLSVAFSPDGRILASSANDKVVRLWSVPDGALLAELADHGSWVWGTSFSEDGRLLATASMDGAIRIWDVAQRVCLAALLSMPDGWVACTPDGRYKLGGDIAGGFWHVANLSRFDPGELDRYVPGLRLPDDAPLLPLR